MKHETLKSFIIALIMTDNHESLKILENNLIIYHDRDGLKLFYELCYKLRYNPETNRRHATASPDKTD